MRGGGGRCKKRRVWGVMKEGQGSNVAVDGKDFGKEVGRIDEAREKYKTEKLLAGPLLEPIKSHVDRLRLLWWKNRRSRKTDATLIVNKQERV